MKKAHHQVIAELQSRLCRLIFAALDTFPLSDGRENGLVVLAVRSVPAFERLDATVSSVLQELEQGSHRPPVQLKARQIHLQIADEDGDSNVAVNWHELVDFSRLLQKGVPSALEAIRHSRDSPEVLHATDEWWELKESLAKALAPEHPTTTQPYMKACAGAALSLLRQAETAKRSQGAGYQPQRMTVEATQKVSLLATRAATEQEAAEINAMEQSGEMSVTAWKPLLQRLSAAAETAAPLPKLECLDTWCRRVRDTDYEKFKQDFQTIEIKPDALRIWQERLAGAKGGLSLQTCESGQDAAAELDEESAEAMKHVEGLIPTGSELVFLAQTGSFMYDLQVETSDMDFALIYQALPESLLSLTPPRDEFSKHVHKGFATNKKGVVEYSGRELGFFISNLAKGNPNNVELLFSGKPAHRSWAWKEILEARQCFLTLRCAKQYLGFISQRLFRARDVLKASQGEDGITLSRGEEFSKLLYHAHHKMLDLGRILKGGYPAVALSGAERQQVLEIRRRRPKLPEAQALLEQAEAQRAQLAAELHAVEADGALPAEVDAQALIQWLWSVRVRMARGADV